MMLRQKSYSNISLKKNRRNIREKNREFDSLDLFKHRWHKECIEMLVPEPVCVLLMIRQRNVYVKYG